MYVGLLSILESLKVHCKPWTVLRRWRVNVSIGALPDSKKKKEIKNCINGFRFVQWIDLRLVHPQVESNQ